MPKKAERKRSSVKEDDIVTQMSRVEIKPEARRPSAAVAVTRVSYHGYPICLLRDQLISIHLIIMYLINLFECLISVLCNFGSYSLLNRVLQLFD